MTAFLAHTHTVFGDAHTFKKLPTLQKCTHSEWKVSSRLANRPKQTDQIDFPRSSLLKHLCCMPCQLPARPWQLHPILLSAVGNTSKSRSLWSTNKSLHEAIRCPRYTHCTGDSTLAILIILSRGFARFEKIVSQIPNTGASLNSTPYAAQMFWLQQLDLTQQPQSTCSPDG